MDCGITSVSLAWGSEPWHADKSEFAYQKNLSDEELWNERFHYTEDELILLQDARFEQKPFFTVDDIMENPFAGGVSAFCAISDNYFLPQLKGVTIDRESGIINTDTLMINSLGNIEHWRLSFKPIDNIDSTAKKMTSPKSLLINDKKLSLEKKIRDMASDEVQRLRLRLFFISEYYPAIIHTSGKMAVLEKTIESLIGRDALNEQDREIVRAIVKAIPEWFISAS